MADNLTLAGRLQLDSQRWVQGLTHAQSKTHGFVSGVRREMGALRSFLGSTAGVLASVGIGYTATDQIMKSGKLDQTLTRIRQTADASKEQVKQLRVEIFRMAKESGSDVESLAGGFNALVQSGQSWKSSLSAIDAVNKAVAVTGINGDIAAAALQSMAANFNFDLEKPNQALSLLDKMRVASKLGNAEMENLASIFPRVSQNATGAGLDINQTLAWIEGLSLLERQPERLSTLAESGLRLFTVDQYRNQFTKRTGIDFYNDDRSRRDPLAVISDFRDLYQKLTTDQARDSLMGEATQGFDQDLVKMLRIVATAKEEPGKEGMLAKIRDTFTKRIGGADDTLVGEMPDAMDNAASQAGVLRATLREATDRYSQPLNKALTEAIKFSTSKDGLDLSGGEMLGYGAAGAASLYAASRTLPPMLSKLLGGGASLGSGIVMGNALQQAGAATPVFVVGAAPGLFSGVGAGVIPEAAGKSKRGRLKVLAALGATTYVGGSMVFDERNAGMLDRFNASTADLSHRPGFDWARRGGVPWMNLIQDLITGFKAGGDKKLIVDVNVNDNLTTVRTRTVGKDFANVRSSSSTVATGRAMADRGGGR